MRADPERIRWLHLHPGNYVYLEHVDHTPGNCYRKHEYRPGLHSRRRLNDWLMRHRRDLRPVCTAYDFGPVVTFRIPPRADLED